MINIAPFHQLQIKEEQKKKELKKYTVKPPKDLSSKFEKKQAAKAKAEQEVEEAKRRAEEEERQAVSMVYFNCFSNSVVVHILLCDIFYILSIKYRMSEF